MFLPQFPDLPSASCRTVDPELFYPPPVSLGGRAVTEAAKAVCGTCPERVACLAEALAYESGSAQGRYGIWGGTTPTERARMVGA